MTQPHTQRLVTISFNSYFFQPQTFTLCSQKMNACSVGNSQAAIGAAILESCSAYIVKANVIGKVECSRLLTTSEYRVRNGRTSWFQYHGDGESQPMLITLLQNNRVIPSERNRGWKSPIQFWFFLLMILNLDQKKCHGAKFSPPGAFQGIFGHRVGFGAPGGSKF